MYIITSLPVQLYVNRDIPRRQFVDLLKTLSAPWKYIHVIWNIKQLPNAADRF
jgi:hypothetical protein